MDDLIRQHLRRLQRYALLQNQLDAVASVAFLQLSRCRYHGIKLSTDQFRPELSRHLWVQSHPDINTSDDRDKPLAGIDDTSVVATIDKLVEDLAETPLHTSASDVTQEGAASSHHQATYPNDAVSDKVMAFHGFTEFKLCKGTDKKNDPVRDIEFMPTMTLRQTQAKFHDLVSIIVELANLVAQLRISELNIRETREFTANARVKEKASKKESLDSQKDNE